MTSRTHARTLSVADAVWDDGRVDDCVCMAACLVCVHMVALQTQGGGIVALAGQEILIKETPEHGEPCLTNPGTTTGGRNA